jgi:hypothetical protein
MHAEVIDEDQVEGWCRLIEQGYQTPEELTSTLDELESLLGPAAREKTAALRRLFARKRIPDASARRAEMLRSTKALSMMAHQRNQGAKILAEQRKRFRVEITEPLYADSLPLTFYARIYENDQHHGSISCTVSEEDLAAIPVSNRSLSRRERQRRQIGQFYACFAATFSSYIERQWESGVDLTTRGRITWSEATSR